MRAPALAAVLTAVAVAVSGCGGSDSNDAKKAANDFYTALRSGNGAKACAMLTPEEAQTTGGASGSAPNATCADAIGQIGSALPPASVTSVKVNGSKATVVLSAPSLPITIELEKRNGKWLVAHFS